MSEFAGSSAPLTDVVDDLADAVIVRDAESGAILDANDAVAEIFGWEPAAFCELDAADCAANPAAAAAARADADEAARETGTGTFRWEAERRDGTTFWAEASVSTTRAGDRECLVSVVRDVTARVGRERELERFAAVLAHDLQSPLNAAQAQVNILRREARGGEEFLDRLDRIHDRMIDIVEDVCTFVNDGRRVVESDTVGLERVVENAWEAVGGDQHEGATLVVGDGLGAVAADEGRACRLFENLFENAIRHGCRRDGADSADAGERVTVTVAGLADGRGVAVEDDGPGIPAADRERVFEYGYTTDAGGTGFGLNIVAAAAEAHGWDVAVGESEAGGARFEITGMRTESAGDENGAGDSESGRSGDPQ
ncbi:ATP-binding protein [Halobellus sp. GM3]|uniref:ATP-binding protein n=1 Tax=Halobellus sp. GM3 TaxID=3458410 RepID=UPI00403D7315